MQELLDCRCRSISLKWRCSSRQEPLDCPLPAQVQLLKGAMPRTHAGSTFAPTSAKVPGRTATPIFSSQLLKVSRWLTFCLTVFLDIREIKVRAEQPIERSQRAPHTKPPQELAGGSARDQCSTDRASTKTVHVSAVTEYFKTTVRIE